MTGLCEKWGYKTEVSRTAFA